MPKIKLTPVYSSKSGQWNATKFDYHSTAWRKVRNLFIQTHPICVTCESLGHIRPANVVDHIVPIRFGGEPWDEKNLQALCESCHNEKSAKESRYKTQTKPDKY